MKVCVFSLGCKVNQYEGQAIADALRAAGAETAQELVAADVYLFNTCSVTAEADKKSRQLIAKARRLNPSAPVYIIGCSSQNNPAPYAERDSVIYISGTAGKKDVAARILSGHAAAPAVVDVRPLPSVYEEFAATGHSRTRAHIKIQDGCNNFCSYCIVPYLRGRSRSRSPEAVLAEARAAAAGTKEIVFTGIDLSSYGKDIGTDLVALIRDAGDINVRKRLGSLECGVISEPLLEAMRDSGFCPHFHLSLQSGSDTVLRRMNRHYTAADYAKKVDLIRGFFPDAGITTDIICGFPGETDIEHAASVAFTKAIGFSDIHVFPYSERAGTVAAAMPQPVDKRVRLARAAEMGEVKKALHAAFLRSMSGRVFPVYYEEVNDGLAHGYTGNYVKVYAAATPGEIENTCLTTFYKDGIQGEIV